MMTQGIQLGAKQVRNSSENRVKEHLRSMDHHRGQDYEAPILGGLAVR